MIKKVVPFFWAILFAVVFLVVSVSAQEAVYTGAVLTAEGFPEPSVLSDGNERSYTAAQYGGSVTITRDGGISFLYVVFDRIPESWTLTDVSGGAQAVCGENSFLHEYVDVSSRLGNKPETVRLDFPAGTSIAEIYAFGDGAVPDWVQRWSPPCEQADLLLLSSHSDDEQLFFAGVLPIYAGERGLNVQVVYLVNHFYNDHIRPHEQLDGLWTVGVHNYPVMSDFPDLYSESLEAALAAYQVYGYGYDDFTGFITGILRRFKPLVVVTHDVNGEYGHGTHRLSAAALMDSIVLAADESNFPDSAALYGTWETEKAYLHLYPENPITLDLDSPLSAFDGKTAFEVTQAGFAKHTSQHWTWFYRWIYGTNDQAITRAADIETYSPCYYGLYSTSVGYDTAGGDFMENVMSYAERNTESQAPDDPGDTNGDADPEDSGKPDDNAVPSDGELENNGADNTDGTETSPPLDRELIVRIAVTVALAAAAVMICMIVIRLRKK